MKYITIFVTLFISCLHIQAQESTKTKAVLINIDGEISPSLAMHIENATQKAIKNGVNIIIYKLNTFGGRVDSALKICDTINTNPKIKTIAWVNTRAISAGALISMSCNEIIMTHGAQIGDCQPIVGGNNGAPTPAGEKIETVLRSQFRSFARRNGYSQPLAEAFVDQSIEVYKFKLNGKTTYLSKQQYQDLSKIKKNRYTQKKTIIAKGKLLTIDNSEALEMGFSKANIKDISELKQYYNLQELPSIKPNWSENLTMYLTSSGVSSIILIIALVAMWTEFKMPGFGMPGLTSIACFSILLGARYLSGLADIPYIIMVFTGIVLIVIELFIIPGTMLFGLIGFGLFLMGLVLSFTGGIIIPDTPLQTDFVFTQMQILSGSFATSIVIFLILAYYLPDVPVFNAIALKTTLDKSITCSNSQDDLINQIGIASTDLRPSGKIIINDKTIDVVTEGCFINRGEQVKIIGKNITHFTVTHIHN